MTKRNRHVAGVNGKEQTMDLLMKLPPRRLLLLSLVFCLGGGLEAGISLLERSPFIPRGWTPPEERGNRRERPAQTAGGTLEFGGVYELNGVVNVFLSDSRQNKGQWVRVNDPTADIPVLSFDRTALTIRVRRDGKEETIPLAKTTDKQLPLHASMSPGAVNRRAQAGPPQPENAATRPNRPPRRRIVSPSDASNLNARERAAIEARRRWNNADPNSRPPTPPPDFEPPPLPQALLENGPPQLPPGLRENGPPELPPGLTVPNFPEGMTPPSLPPNFTPPPPPNMTPTQNPGG